MLRGVQAYVWIARLESIRVLVRLGVRRVWQGGIALLGVVCVTLVRKVTRNPPHHHLMLTRNQSLTLNLTLNLLILGYYSTIASHNCTKCAAGKVTVAETESCTNCAPGKFAGIPGTSTCFLGACLMLSFVP